MTQSPKLTAASPRRRWLRENRSLIAAGAASAALAGAALFNRARARRAEAATPPIGRFVEVDGVRLHYVERGEGRPVVLLHGNGAMIQDWEVSGVLGAATKDFRVIAFDRPGFGYSGRPRSTIWTPTAQAALIVKACRTLGIVRPVVVGHSWATLVALAWALDHPGDVAGLVLLSGYYFPTARPDVLMLSPPSIPIVGDVLRFTVSPLAGRAMAPAMFKTMFAPAAVPPRLVDWPVGLSLRPSQLRASAADTALMVPAAAALRRRYAELELPVVIVGGDGDKIAHFGANAEKLHAELPGSSLVMIPGVGHMVHYADPDAIVRAITQAANAAPL